MEHQPPQFEDEIELESSSAFQEFSAEIQEKQQCDYFKGDGLRIVRVVSPELARLLGPPVVMDFDDPETRVYRGLFEYGRLVPSDQQYRKYYEKELENRKDPRQQRGYNKDNKDIDVGGASVRTSTSCHTMDGLPTFHFPTEDVEGTTRICNIIPTPPRTRSLLNHEMPFKQQEQREKRDTLFTKAEDGPLIIARANGRYSRKTATERKILPSGESGRTTNNKGIHVHEKNPVPSFDCKPAAVNCDNNNADNDNKLDDTQQLELKKRMNGNSESVSSTGTGHDERKGSAPSVYETNSSLDTVVAAHDGFMLVNAISTIPKSTQRDEGDDGEENNLTAIYKTQRRYSIPRIERTVPQLMPVVKANHTSMELAITTSAVHLPLPGHDKAITKTKRSVAFEPTVKAKSKRLKQATLHF